MNAAIENQGDISDQFSLGRSAEMLERMKFRLSVLETALIGLNAMEAEPCEITTGMAIELSEIAAQIETVKGCVARAWAHENGRGTSLAA